MKTIEFENFDKMHFSSTKFIYNIQGLKRFMHSCWSVTYRGAHNRMYSRQHGMWFCAISTARLFGEWKWNCQKTCLCPLNQFFGKDSGSLSATTATERVVDKTMTALSALLHRCRACEWKNANAHPMVWFTLYEKKHILKHFFSPKLVPNCDCETRV